MKYVADGHLTSTPKFITADVTDLYKMIPRRGALDALARFCIKHANRGKIGTLLKKVFDFATSYKP